MFEFSIALNENNANFAKKLFKEIKESVTMIGGVVTSYCENEKVYIIVACDEIERERISFFICDAIAELISTKFKMQFINKNLHLPISNKTSLDALKKALVAFDRETDKYIITHNLRLNKNFFVESFYEFKLKQLRLKWFELIKLANENSSYLLCNDTFIDLLKFLIDNIEISNELINVVKNENGFKICDANFNEIENDDADEQINNNEAFLITSLITLSPKKINVYCELGENSSALTLISQLFENRVNILPNIKWFIFMQAIILTSK